jgi:hypothetical protein
LAGCFLQHDIHDFFVLAELAFVLAVRGLKSEQVVPEHVLGCLRTRCLFQLLKLLRLEFEFSSSVVWGELLRGSELPASALALIRADKIEDLLSPDQSDGDDDESRDELWLQSPHPDLDPQSALELQELAQEIWARLCAGDLRIPERWQQGDELIAFLRECGLRVGEADYKRMLRRNKARRARAQVKNNNPEKGAKPSVGAGCAGRVALAVQAIPKQFPRQHLMERHDRILSGIAHAFRSAGLDAAPAGAEYGGERFDPDLFVKPRHEQSGFYLEIKTPQRERIAIDLDEWTYFRTLGNVLVLAVWGDGRCAVIDVDNDRPLFWGAADDDRIPVLAADQLRVLDVPLKLFDRGDPSYTSNKPFVVLRPRHTYRTLEQALAAVLRKVGISGG